MRFFRDTSISIKVLLPPMVLVLALVIVSLLAIYGLNVQGAALSEVNDIALERITLIDEFIAISEFGVLLVRSSTVPFTKLRSILTEFLDYQQAKIAHAETEANRKAQTFTTAIIILSFLITLAGILTIILISTRLISQPIRSMTTLMGQLANGDLTKEVGELERRDEIGAMARAVEVFQVIRTTPLCSMGC